MRPKTKVQVLIAFVVLAISYGPSTLLAQTRRQIIPAQQRYNANERIAVAATELGRDLRDAKNLLRSLSDRKVRRELEALLLRAEANLGVMKTELIIGDTNWKVLTDSEFLKLLQQVKKRSLSKKKAEYLNSYTKLALSTRTGDRLTSAQVKRLLTEIEFDNDRVSTAALLFEITADQQNFRMALDAITFDRNRKTVLRRVGLTR